MKVALLLFGQPRNIDNDNVYQSHKNFILNKYDTDVFCHTWKCSDKEYLKSPWCDAKNLNVIKNANEIISERYSPKFLDYENEISFSLSEYQQGLFMKHFDSNKWNQNTNNNTLSQLYSINRVSKSFKSYQEMYNIIYDFVIITRYDFILKSFPDLTELNPENFHLIDIHPRFPDILYIFNPKFLITQFSYENLDYIFEKCVERNVEPCAENLKYHQFKKYFNDDILKPLNIKFKRN